MTAWVLGAIWLVPARALPEDAKSSKGLGLIFGFQDTTMLEGDVTRLQTFYDLGVRISQPTYNRRNLMGDGCLEAADGGLSDDDDRAAAKIAERHRMSEHVVELEVRGLRGKLLSGHLRHLHKRVAQSAEGRRAGPLSF